jgi:hypothetical protein
MYNYYSALTTYENENKMNNIENNITETLLVNNEIERRNEFSGKKCIIIVLLVAFVIATTFGLLYYYNVVNL